MEVKKIVEGMTAVEVAEVIDSNFKNQNKILEEDIATQNSVIGVSEYKDFSEAEEVSVGDVRKYEGFLYECVEATTGAFDASKWKKSSFKAETEKKLSELGSKVIKNLGDSSYVVSSFRGFEHGTLDVYGNNVENMGRWRSKELIALPIIDGKAIELKVTKSDNIKIYLYWYNTDGLFLSYDNAIIVKEFIATPPASAAYVRVLILPTVETSKFTTEMLESSQLTIRANSVDSVKLFEDLIKNKGSITDLQKRTLSIGIYKTGVGINSEGEEKYWDMYCIFNKFWLAKGDTIQISTSAYGCCVIATQGKDASIYTPLVKSVDNKPDSTQVYSYTAPEDMYVICTGITDDSEIVVICGSLLEKISSLEKNNKDIQESIGNIQGTHNLFSSNWTLGSYYEDINAIPNRKYKVLPVILGEMYKIVHGVGWNMYIYFADEIGVIDYIYITTSTELTIGVRNGRIPTEIRCTAIPNPDKSIITDDLWATFDIEMYNVTNNSKLNKVVVAEWNFGLLNNGVVPLGIEDDKVDEYLPNIKKLITLLGADILYTTEYVEELDRSQTRNTYNELLKQFYPYYYYGGNYMAIFSKYPFSVQSITSPDGRNCEFGTININGNTIGFGEIHPRSASGAEAEDARIADHQAVVDYFANYDKVIVGGDFNTYEDRELDVYRDAGWNLGNCGYFGNIDTYRPSERPWYIDNIITKGVNIDNFIKLDDRAEVSDHYPVVANLSFLGTYG